MFWKVRKMYLGWRLQGRGSKDCDYLHVVSLHGTLRDTEISLELIIASLPFFRKKGIIPPQVFENVKFPTLLYLMLTQQVSVTLPLRMYLIPFWTGRFSSSGADAVLAFMELVAGVGLALTNEQSLTKELKSERQDVKGPRLRYI